MNQYTIYCTKEQTMKAMEFGAPIEILPNYTEYREFPLVKCKDGNDRPCVIPTAEQMIGWLRTKGFAFYIAEYNDHFNDHVFWRVANNHDKSWYKYDDKLNDPKEANISAIDAALDYLTNQKTNKI